jgi:hypothetical protein
MPNKIKVILQQFIPTDNNSLTDIWFNPQRKQFWLLLTILLYTSGGFLLAPWLITSQVIPSIADDLGRTIQLEKLKINPYTLSVEAQGFKFTELDGAPLFNFSRLFINFQLSSVFRRAWTFREITLEQPDIDFIREDTGATNYGRLLSELTPADTQTPQPEEATELPRLIIDKLAIVDGVIELNDFVPQPKVTAHFAPINITINDLSTLPAVAGQQKVRIAMEPNGRVEWSGSLQLNPLLAEGRFEGGGRYLPIMYRYIEDQVAFEVSEGQAEFTLNYLIEERSNGEFAVQVDDLDFHLRGIEMHSDNPVVKFLSLPNMSLTSGNFRWPEQTVQFDGFTIDGARLHVIRNQHGILNLQQLVPPNPNPDTEPEITETEGSLVVHPLQAWSLDLGKLNIIDFGVKFEDQSLTATTATIPATINLLVHDITNREGAQSSFEMGIELNADGAFSLDGQLELLPTLVVDTSLKIDQLALQVAQPWIAEFARVEIDAGLLNADTQVRIDSDEPLALQGSMNIESLDISDMTKDERLLGWSRLAIDQLAFSTTANSLEVSKVSLASPYARILIAADQTTNFSELTISVDTDESAARDHPKVEPTNPLAVTVGQIDITDGSADFTDLSLPLPFATRMNDLQGQISTLATVSVEPAQIELQGQVGKYGLTTVSGQLLPSDPTELTDIELVFRNLSMSDLSPYTVKFASRSIDDGKLDVTLKYLIESGLLLGENKIVMRDLTLGDKIDHPEAANLPLGLAVALLKQPDGSIDLDLPVSGDVNDPEFSVGGVVFKAFVNLITKVATSPFRLLGGLVGADAEGLDQIEFRPGRSDLTPPELEKLTKLTEALTLRPGLGLQLQGAVDTQADIQAMQAERVNLRIEARLGDATADTDQKMLTQRRRKAVEELVQEQLPELDITAIKEQSKQPKDPEKPDGKQTLDEPLYTRVLEARLIAAEPIGDADLDELAMARVVAIRDSVLSDGRLTTERLVTDTTKITVTITENGWIPMKLNLDASAIASD